MALWVVCSSPIVYLPGSKCGRDLVWDRARHCVSYVPFEADRTLCTSDNGADSCRTLSMTSGIPFQGEHARDMTVRKPLNHLFVPVYVYVYLGVCHVLFDNEVSLVT